MRHPPTCPATAKPLRGLRGHDLFLETGTNNNLPFLRSFPIRLVWPARKTDAKTTPKERETVMATTIGRPLLPLEEADPVQVLPPLLPLELPRSPPPSSAAPAVGHYCAKAAMKSRCASPEVVTGARGGVTAVGVDAVPAVRPFSTRISLLFAEDEAAEEFVFTKRCFARIVGDGRILTERDATSAGVGLDHCF